MICLDLNATPNDTLAVSRVLGEPSIWDSASRHSQEDKREELGEGHHL